MKKLKLDLELLGVQSFQTAGVQPYDLRSSRTCDGTCFENCAVIGTVEAFAGSEYRDTVCAPAAHSNWKDGCDPAAGGR